VKRLHFEQRRRSPDLVLRSRTSKHQPLAAERFDARELCPHVIDPFARLMRVMLRVLRTVDEQELAVERHRRDVLHEPIRRMKDVAETRDEALAVPIGAHAVELLAHPPADEIDVAVPAVREEQRRRHALIAALPCPFGRFGALRRRCTRCGTDSCGLRRFRRRSLDLDALAVLDLSHPSTRIARKRKRVDTRETDMRDVGLE
jgi:hypothetical protein